MIPVPPLDRVARMECIRHDRDCPCPNVPCAIVESADDPVERERRVEGDHIPDCAHAPVRAARTSKERLLRIPQDLRLSKREQTLSFDGPGVRLPLMAEEEPVLSPGFYSPALLQKGAKWRHARSRPHHDDGRRRIGRQREAMRRLDIGLERLAFGGPLGKKSGGDAETLALADHIAHGVDGQRQAPGGGLWRRGYGIETRLQRLERLDGVDAAQRGANLLGTLGNNAPFVGLFGTVIGVIEAFSHLGSSAAGAGMAKVMGGIAEALIATGVGIFVAIPAVVAYNYFVGRVKIFTQEMDRAGQVLVEAVLREATR